MAEGFSPAALRGFELFFRPWLRRRIRLRVAGLPPALPRDIPLLLVANHTSWWDPFLLRELHRSLRPGSPLYTLMLEAELERRPFFRRIGVIGIDPASPASVRGALRTLERRLRSRPDATVTYFPQGRIWPTTRRPLGFRRGIEVLARRLPGALVLPVAIHVEPLAGVAPVAFLHAMPAWRTDEAFQIALVESAVARGLDRITTHLARFGENAADAWPPADG